MPATHSVTLRPATQADVELLLTLIRELAEFERLGPDVSATAERLSTSLFGDRPAAEAVIAQRAGQALGFALYFQNYSTFRGQAGIYLEDLYVREPARGQGVGKALLMYVARVAHERNAGRFEWAALDWNERAIQFYQSLGAKPMCEWTVFRMTSDEIARLVEGENSSP